MTSHGSIGISSSACGPLQSLVDQQFIQFATARVHIPSSTCVLFIAVDHQCVMDVIKHALASHIFLVPVPVFLGASSSSIVSRFQLFGCSPHRNRSTSQRIDPGTLVDRLTIPTKFVSPTQSRVPRAPVAKPTLANVCV